MGLYSLLGKKHAYFVLYNSRFEKLPLGLVEKGPPLNGTDTKYDFNEIIWQFFTAHPGSKAARVSAE